MHIIRPASQIIVQSTHPLVFQAINKLLESVVGRVTSFEEVHIKDLKGSAWILILDAHSVKEWLKLVVRCCFHGGRCIVVLPDHMASEEEEIRLIYLGVQGIVLVTEIESQLPAAVRAVAEGRLWFRRSTLAACAGRTSLLGDPGGHHLTRRQEQIIMLLAQGFSDKEIANALGISVRTAKFHVGNILRKFNVKNRKALFKVQTAKVGRGAQALPERQSA